MLTAARLRELLHYNPETGTFTWRVSQGRARAGEQAGGVEKSSRYRKIRVDSILYTASKVAWLYVKGEWPQATVDHENRKRADDSWVNLRPATRKQNCENISVRQDNAAGRTGVSWHVATSRWVVQIQHNKKKMHVGYQETLLDAVALRMRIERELFTHVEHAQ